MPKRNEEVRTENKWRKGMKREIWRARESERERMGKKYLGKRDRH